MSRSARPHAPVQPDLRDKTRTRRSEVGAPALVPRLLPAQSSASGVGARSTVGVSERVAVVDCAADRAALGRRFRAAERRNPEREAPRWILTVTALDNACPDEAR